MGLGGLGPITKEDVLKQEERDEFWRKKQLEGTIGTETLDSAINVAKTVGRQFFNPENENTQRLSRGLQTAGKVFAESYQDTREFGEWYDLKQNIPALGLRGIEATGAVVSNVVGKPVAGVARQFGFDPRIAGSIAFAAELAATAGVAKGASIAKAQVKGTFTGITQGLGGTGMASSAQTISKVTRPSYIGRYDWNKLVTKFSNSEKSARWGSELIKEAHDYFKGKGSLKDFGSVRIDPNTGKSWLIKNKRGTQKTAELGAPRFGLDSLENTTAGRIIRETTAKVNEKDVWAAARKIQKVNPDITDDVIKAYIKAQKKHKRDLQTLIKNLNYDEGARTWSLGHREAVKSFTKRNEVGADIIQNLELEPFRDLFDSKTGRWIRGNASRSADDELERILLRASNQSTNIGEDILKFADPEIRDFWPRMDKITNKEEWIKQTGLREQYYDNIRALAKKEGISLQEATDDYLLDIMSKTKRSKAPLFK